jgi:hypothetical protein
MYLHKTINNVNRPILTSNLPCRSGLGTNLRAEGVNFSNDQLFHSFFTVFLLEPEIELLNKSVQTFLRVKLDIEDLRRHKRVHQRDHAKLASKGGSVLAHS